MAKSNPDSNGLRQDQPEWVPRRSGAGWRLHRNQETDRVSPNCRGSHQTPSVRRTAGVGSSSLSGPKRTPGRVLNPSKRRSDRAEGGPVRGRPPSVVHVQPNCPVTLKGTGSPSCDSGRSGRGPNRASFAFNSNGRPVNNPVEFAPVRVGVTWCVSVSLPARLDPGGCTLSAVRSWRNAPPWGGECPHRVTTDGLTSAGRSRRCSTVRRRARGRS